MKRSTIIGLVFFIFLIALFFNKIILNPEDAVTVNSDLLRMTSLWEKQINENLEKNNELILWNSDVYSGTPFIGSPLTTMFYPLSIIFYFVPFHKAFAYFMIINMLLMSIFFYMYMRLIRVSKFSSLFSTVIFVFSGMVILWSGIISFINVIIWFPLLLYLTERLVLEKRLVFGLLIGLFLGIQVLGGGPQIFLYSSFILFLYLMLRVLYERKESKKIIGIFLAGVTISILVCSVQLLPMLEYSKYSIRDTSLDYDTATMHSLPGYSLITFFMPEFYGKGNLYWGFWKHSSFAEQYIYIGLVTLMLLLLAVFFIRKNKYVTIFAIIAAFSLLFSFGKYTPFFSLFYHLPLFNSFRAPVRMMVFFVFSAAVISGFSLDNLSNFDEQRKNKLKKLFFILCIMVSLMAAIAIISYAKHDLVIRFGKEFVRSLYAANMGASRITRSGLSQDYFLSLVPSVFKNIINSISIFLFLMVAILFSFYLWIYDKIRLRHFKIALLLILIIELFIFSTGFIEPKKFEDKFKTNPIIDHIKKSDGIFRVLSLRSYQTKDNLPQYLALYNNIQLASGCDAIFLRRYAEYSCSYGNCEVKPDACIPINEVKYPKMIDLLNVKYAISPNEVNDTSMRFIMNYNGANLYENTNYLERAFFVPRVMYLNESENALNLIANGYIDLTKYAVIESGDKEKYRYNVGSYRELKITHYSQNKVTIEGDFRGDGFVVLSDVDYPGWKAYVDGKEVELYNTDYLLKGIYISSGVHRIEFKYDPMSYKIGLYVSVTSIVILIIVIFWLRKSI